SSSARCWKRVAPRSNSASQSNSSSTSISATSLGGVEGGSRTRCRSGNTWGIVYRKARSRSRVFPEPLDPAREVVQLVAELSLPHGGVQDVDGVDRQQDGVAGQEHGRGRDALAEDGGRAERAVEQGGGEDQGRRDVERHERRPDHPRPETEVAPPDVRRRLVLR